MTVPVIEDEERLWRVTDAFGRLLDPQPKQDGRNWAILDMHRRVGGSSGIVLKRPHSEDPDARLSKGTVTGGSSRFGTTSKSGIIAPEKIKAQGTQAC